MAEREPQTRLGEQDLYLFNEGTHLRIWQKLGAHRECRGGVDGVAFAVWAPNAAAVSVIGDWNDWEPGRHPLVSRANSGIWEGFVAGVPRGAAYKYRIDFRAGGGADKADPFALHAETPPATASIVWDLEYQWTDQEWMQARAGRAMHAAPTAIYEVHLGSWRQRQGEADRFFSYREIAAPLADYAHDMGFTHVEFLPLTEHPFYGSWGYQTTAYFAPTSRYGSPQDLMYLIDHLHARGIGVILDWVPSHFPDDEHGLGLFDGTHLFEHADPRQGYHPDWNSLIFNYGRKEVQSFLVSSALFWLERYHIDALRVDAVASMLYLDYSRKSGEWVANEHGGRENLEAIDLLRRLNEDVYREVPGIQTIAEESTAWPMVSKPTYLGGLGFGFKWDMGWMHDTLLYLSRDPVHRRHHHQELVFRTVYAFNENFVLPLSHDEVVHGKGSLLAKMPGDDWQKRASLRVLFGYMWTQPGKKLLFMGGETGQLREWNHETGLDWSLLERAEHQALQRWVRDLNTWYRATPALHVADCDGAGFRWIDCNDAERSILVYSRHDPDDRAGTVVVACNFTPEPRHNFRIGVDREGEWDEVINSDASLYGGSGQGNLGRARTSPVGSHDLPQSLNVTLPPLSVVAFEPTRR